MNRIDRKFKELKKKKEKALILYMTAGDPSLAKNEALIPQFEKEGADMIELGIPFSDPLADGPVIQEASRRSLAHQTTLDKIFKLARDVRKKSQIPLLFMSYFNPILQYGVERFARTASRAGVDGVIIPDMPLEEGKDTSRIFRRQGLHFVYLLAPTTSFERARRIAKASSGFLYYVSITGVTGARRELPRDLAKNIAALKKKVRLPLCVGFGISEPAQAAEMAKVADGVIIGSALVKALKSGVGAGFVRPFAKALGKKGV